MNVLCAAHEMHILVLHKDGYWCKEGPLSREHILYMIRQIEWRKVIDEKAHRWMGWIQAACCNAGIVSLEQLKDINHRC